MKAKRFKWSALCPVFLLTLAVPALSQMPDRPSPSGFRLGLGFEYFSQTISWNDLDTERTSEMTSALASLILGYKAGPGFYLAAIVGYSSSNFDGLIFRHVPFSREIGSGGMSGALLGGELSASIIRGRMIGLEAFGQALAYFGVARTSELAGLAVSGDAESKPSWMRVTAGPVIRFGRSTGFRPYIYPNLRYLKGKYEFSETIQNLKGQEKKDLTGQGQFGLSAGADMILSEPLSLRAEAGLYPRSDGNDFTVNIKMQFGF
jgi:hypothetical protein